MKFVKKRIFVATLLLVFAGYSVLSYADEIISAPHGFWVTSSEKKRELFGPSSVSADWHIAQWNSPNPDLGIFYNGMSKGTNQRVRVIDGFYEIEADGQGLACNREFDSFAGANNTRVYKHYPSAYFGSPTLAEMHTLNHRIGVTPMIEMIQGKDCKMTKGVLMTAIVFHNTETDDTFFYQLRLRKIGAKMKPFWWSKGQPKGTHKRYGFGDNLDSYGLSDAELNKHKVIDIDLLPRIKALLLDQSIDIDRNPAHWIVTSAYHGQAMWGNLKLSSRWESFRLEYK